MTEISIVIARPAPDAGARIGAVRAEHLAQLGRLAEGGDLLAGVPLLDEAGSWRGSLIVLRPAALDAYLAAEPFRREGIWASHAVHPARLAGLPYGPLPAGTASPTPTHCIVIGRDGRDEGALQRRLAVRGAHFARANQAAAEGV